MILNMGVFIKGMMSILKGPPKDSSLCCSVAYYGVWSVMVIIAIRLLFG